MGKMKCYNTTPAKCTLQMLEATSRLRVSVVMETARVQSKQ